jgi:hypothetical protein
MLIIFLRNGISVTKRFCECYPGVGTQQGPKALCSERFSAILYQAHSHPTFFMDDKALLALLYREVMPASSE